MIECGKGEKKNLKLERETWMAKNLNCKYSKFERLQRWDLGKKNKSIWVYLVKREVHPVTAAKFSPTMLIQLIICQ